MRNLSKGPVLNIEPSQKVQPEVIYLPYVVRKAAANFPKIVAYMVKIVKFLVPIISEHP